MPKRATKPKSRDLVPKGGGVPSKQAMYAYVSQYTQEAIEVLVDLMRHSRQDTVRVGAANKLLDKSIPDLAAIKVQGDMKTEHVIRFMYEQSITKDPERDRPASQELPETTSDI